MTLRATLSFSRIEYDWLQRRILERCRKVGHRFKGAKYDDSSSQLHINKTAPGIGSAEQVGKNFTISFLRHHGYDSAANTDYLD